MTDEETEDKRRSYEKAVFILLRVFIVAAFLVAILILAFVSYITLANGGTSRSHTQGQDLMILNNGNKIYSLDPLDPQLKCLHLVTLESPSSLNYEYSKALKRVYFKDEGIRVFYFDWFLAWDLKLPGFTDLSSFKLMKSGPNGIIYTATNEAGSLIFRHYDLVEKRIVYDYKTKCEDERDVKLLDQSLGGSKLLYFCNEDYHVYKKKLNMSNDEDETVIFMDGYYDTILTRDESHLIIFDFSERSWRIVDLNSEDPLSNAKSVYFDFDIYTIWDYSYSADKSTIYIVLKYYPDPDCPVFAFHAIDVENILNSYSTEYDPFQIGQGRQIKI